MPFLVRLDGLTILLLKKCLFFNKPFYFFFKEEFRNLSILSFYLKSFLVPVSFQNYYTKLGAIEQEGEFFENYTYFTRKLAPKHLKMGHLSILPPLTTQFLSCPILSVKHCIATVNKLRSNK